MEAEKSDPLHVLLNRAMDDDGPEGEVAWNMFVSRAKGKPGKLFFLTEDYANPLMYVVESLDAEIGGLKAEVTRLKAFVSRTLRSCELIIDPKSKRRE